MARLKLVLALLLTTARSALSLQYQLIQEYNSTNFFEEFSFFAGPDPTNGYVQYVPFDTAATTGLIGNGSGLVYLGVDSTNVYTPGGPGRPSVRLESKMTFTEGIFVIDLTHMPAGCGVWPAFWTAGLGDWPADGEIDIIENVNDARTNNIALHATGNCSVAGTKQTGRVVNRDCNIVHDENQGCAVTVTEPFNYGAEFNANGGGVYAMEWTSTAIRIWFFPPSGVPESLFDDYEGIPDPESFGTPSASFAGPCSDSFGEKFFNHSIIIDTTFCGGWSGGTFGSGSSSCPVSAGKTPIESCVDYVAANPAAMEEAYWRIKSIRVYEKVPGYEPYTYGNRTTPIHLLPPVTRPFPEAPEPTDGDVWVPEDYDTPLEYGSSSDSASLGSTITSIINVTTTSIFFAGETQESLALDGFPPVATPYDQDDLFDAVAVPTLVPDTTVSALESPLANITVPIPINVSPKTGGALSLGNDPGELASQPAIPDNGEVSDSLDDPPSVGTVHDPFADVIDPLTDKTGVADPSILPAPVSPDIGGDSLLNPYGIIPEPSSTVIGIAGVSSSGADDGTSVSPTPGLLTTPDDSTTPNISPEVVPPELLKNPPPTSVWGSIGDDLKSQLLELAAKLPAAGAPVVDNAIIPVSDQLSAPPVQNAITPASGQPLAPSVQNGNNNQVLSGLLGLLGGQAQNRPLQPLDAGLGLEASRQDISSGIAPPGQPHVYDALSDSTVEQPSIDTSALLIKPATESQPLANATHPAGTYTPPLSDLPSTPPLESTDTKQAVSGLLSLLDENAKNQLLSLLLPDLGPVHLPLQDEDGTTYCRTVAKRSSLQCPDYEDGSWTRSGNSDNAAGLVTRALLSPPTTVLSKDATDKLDSIITSLSNVPDATLTSLATNPLAVLNGLRDALTTIKAKAMKTSRRSAKGITPAVESDLMGFVSKYQTYYPNPSAISEEQFAALLGVYTEDYPPDLEQLYVNNILGPEDNVVKSFAIGYFLWITKHFPHMTKQQQDELVDFSYHHTQPSTKNRRQEMQPKLNQLRDRLNKDRATGASSDDVESSQSTELMDTITDPSIDSETKIGLMREVLHSYDSLVKSYIFPGYWQGYTRVADALHTLSTDEQRQFHDRVEDFPSTYNRLAVPSQQNGSDPIGDNDQGFLEQQIYTICPNLDELPIAELIGDLEGGRNSTLETALMRFKARLEAYTAKLHQCSARISKYAEALKTFIDSNVSPDTERASQETKAKRQSGLPSFDAFIKHKHDDDLDEWKYSSLSQTPRDALHTFVAQAAKCALSNPTGANSSPNVMEPCITALFATWSKVAPFIATNVLNTTRPTPSPSRPWIRIPPPQAPQMQDHTDSAEEADILESLLSIGRSDTGLSNASPSVTPPTDEFVVGEPPNKYYKDLINPTWVTNLRNLVFKASANTKVPFPVQYVHWLRDSLQKNWGNLSKDVQQSILASLAQQAPAVDEGGDEAPPPSEYDTPYEGLPDTSESTEPPPRKKPHWDWDSESEYEDEGGYPFHIPAHGDEDASDSGWEKLWS